MPVCLGLPMEMPVVLPVEAFTLAWTHSVEQTEWREEWRLADGRLRLVGAQVAGSGAGVEPPPGAALHDGVWQWHADVPTDRLTLANSAFGGAYRLCWAGACQPLAELLPATASGPVEIYACRPGEG